MHSLKKVSFALAALLATTAMASAADIVEEPPVYEQPPEVVAVGGWYLRGDIGYSHMDVDGADFYVHDYSGASFPAPVNLQFSSHDLGDGWSISGGIGYQVTNNFRVDLTAGRYSSSGFSGNSAPTPTFACSDLSPDNGIADTCAADDTASFHATTLLANAYFDMGTFAGFTPYVGAGIGGAYTHWGNLSNDINCVSGDCVNGFGADYSTLHDGTHGAKNGWRMAYALHAGASYDLSQNLKFDAGYSFIHIGGGEMFGFSNGYTGTQGYHGDIKIHEVKAGLRYTFH